MAAGGCVGSLAIIVPDPELDSIVNDHLIGKLLNQVFKSEGGMFLSFSPNLLRVLKVFDVRVSAFC